MTTQLLLQKACEKGNTEAVKFLIDDRANINEKNFYDNNEYGGVTLTYIAKEILLNNV